MEKVPAACALGWSIDLEKNLRSKNPGKCIESLKEIGSRLEWWNTQSELKPAEYVMFGLIPGEDKLFLNAILLRLADAFRFGDKQVKRCVVELFRRMRKEKEGILSKDKLENYVELLRRVKEVYDGGDVEERGLALVLFGCWAYFANDSAVVRYIVLSSLVSGDAVEVKAALFTAGCLCELSDGFAHVFLEILTTLVNSPEAPRSVKLAGARAFSKMWCSLSVAEKAYKTGFTILMESTDDNFTEVMLISLSGIASRWMLLIPDQLELLAKFLSEERSLHMQMTSLRGHRIILARGVCNFPFTPEMVHKLFGILQRSDFPGMQLETLKLLHKILSNLSFIKSKGMPEFFCKLLSVIENMFNSSIKPTKALAIWIIFDISKKLLGRADMTDQTASLGSLVISFVFDQICILVTTGVEREVKSLLRLIYNLVEKLPHLGFLVLDNICLFIDKLMKILDKEKMESSDVDFSAEVKVLFYLSKIVGACLRNLEETNSETSLILDALKLQLGNVCNCIYIDSFTCLSYYLLLHVLETFFYHQHIGEEHMSSADSILHIDLLAVDYVNKLLERNSYWSSYQAGKLAASQGAWTTSALVFERLRTAVHSASCSCWLKSLALVSSSEKQIQRFLVCNILDERRVSSVMENLLTTCETLHTAADILAATDMRENFSFQIWFLILRAKYLKSIADVMKLLAEISFLKDGSVSVRQMEKGTLLRCTTSDDRFTSLIHAATHISVQMRKLAQEFDLLLLSSIAIDRHSGMTISTLALTCSLMAFTVGFAFLIPNMVSSENNELEDPLHALLIKDLFGRLNKNGEIRTNFMLLLKSLQTCEGCLLPQFRSHIPNVSYAARSLQQLSKYSVRVIVAMQSKATGVQRDGDVISNTLSDGSQLLFNIMSRLMLIPFCTPCHFFQVRPSVSSELFLMDEEGKFIDGASILSGCQLSLNLCLQIKNVPAGLQGRLKKLFCILSCKKHSQSVTGHKAQEARMIRREEIYDMVELNDKLMKYVIGVESHGFHSKEEADICGMAVNYASFQLNGRGHGFSTCLLNVSALPVGSYRMEWLCGCIDVSGSYWSFLPPNPGPLFTIH